MTGVKKLHLKFADIEVFEHFIISTIFEGVTFGKKELDDLFNVFSTYYTDRPFVSIANRKYDYTIDPNLLTINHPDLLGIAVVCYTKTAKEIAQFEQKFYEGKYEIFSSVDEAKEWSITQLEDYLKKAGL